MLGKKATGPLKIGSWGHTPPGCFLHYPNPKEDPHYNRNTKGNNDGRYSPVCEVCDGSPTQPPLDFYLETLGANLCVQGRRLENASECQAAGDAILEAVGRSTMTVKQGSWKNLPPGCTLRTKTVQANNPPHWNKNDAGNSDGGWSPICGVDNKPKGRYYMEMPGSNKCLHGVKVDEATCEGACQKLLADLGKWAGKSLRMATRDYTPPGCFMHRGIGKEGKPHYSRGPKGDNDGRYSLVCEAVEPLGGWDIIASVFDGQINQEYQIAVTDTTGQTVEIGDSTEITDQISAGFEFEGVSAGVETSMSTRNWITQTTSTTLSHVSSQKQTVSCDKDTDTGRSIQLYRWIVVVGNKLVSTDHFRCHYTDGKTMKPQCPYGFCGANNPLCQENLCSPWRAHAA